MVSWNLYNLLNQYFNTFQKPYNSFFKRISCFTIEVNGKNSGGEIHLMLTVISGQHMSKLTATATVLMLLFRQRLVTLIQ